MAYGQTSTGKTFTMEGLDVDDRDLRGIIPRTIEDIFRRLRIVKEDTSVGVTVSVVEIYAERIRDLLRDDKKHLKVKGVTGYVGTG